MLVGRADVVRIAGLVAEAGDGAPGVVVAHGTDTMEGVALLVDLFHGGDMPVLFTGAQHAAALPGCDCPPTCPMPSRSRVPPAARGIGMAIVFGGRILPAQVARKLDSSGPEAFGPRGTATGRVDGHGARFTAMPKRAPLFALAEPERGVEIAALGAVEAEARARGWLPG